MLYPKIGIRPVIDGRWGGIREGLEEQTMAMARSAAALISENLKYPDGTPVQCVIGCTPIGGYDVGAKRWDRARKLLWRLLAVEAAVGIVATLVAELLPRPLIVLFGAANESVYYTDFAIRAFRIYLCTAALACMNKGAFIFLQSLGKAFSSTMLSMVREIVFGVGFALLLSPLVIEPGRTLTALSQEHSKTLADAGFLLDSFGDNALLLRAAPMGVPLEACGDLLLELLTLLGQGRRDAAVHIFDELLHRVACAAAVKGGDREPPQAGEALVRELLRLPDVRYCPHGRPCVKVVPRSYLEKEFLRG